MKGDAQDKVLHPYFPRDLHLPHYVPNDKSALELLSVFFLLIGAALLLIWVKTGGKKHLQTGGRLKVCWFMACALIHSILEGYFSIYHKTFPGDQSFLSQMWKEYSKGDSRYVSGDSFTVCMETITGFVDGPLAFLAVYAFITHKPYRHVVQLLLSLCQLYGDVLYLTTEAKEGFTHSELYHPLYFWFYFVFLNVLWIIIPSLCVIESCVYITASQRSVDEQTGKKLR